jgi:hypothetical protein
MVSRCVFPPASPPAPPMRQDEGAKARPSNPALDVVRKEPRASPAPTPTSPAVAAIDAARVGSPWPAWDRHT